MKIDLVYLWVNGNDPEWMAKKNLYLPKDKQLSQAAAGDCRFVDHHELKYSLRSAEKYASWINHIYIVTDNQQPDWLDITNPKISIIDHKDIMPKECLPCFNSSVIELYIHNIPGLNEHFLYSNDDMFFGRKVSPDFFYDKKGRPKIRLIKLKKRKNISLYRQQIINAQQKIKKLTGKQYNLYPHHNIDALRRSDIEEFNNLTQKDVVRTSKHRFRKETDLQRVAVLYYVLAKNNLKYIVPGRFNGAKVIIQALKCIFSNKYLYDSRCMVINDPKIETMFDKYHPALFALNDSEDATEQQRERIEPILNKLFPEKSSFEK